MLNKIHDLMSMGFSVTFSREITQFGITITKDEHKELVHLPFDHLTEHKIIKYINLMQDAIDKKIDSEKTKK